VREEPVLQTRTEGAEALTLDADRLYKEVLDCLDSRSKNVEAMMLKTPPKDPIATSLLGDLISALRTEGRRGYDDEYSDQGFDRARDNRAAGFDLSTQQPFPPAKVLSPAEKADRDRESKKRTAAQQSNRPLMLKDLASMIPPSDQFAKVIRNTLHAVKTYGFVPDEMSYYFRKYGALPLKQADDAWAGKTKYVPGSLLK